MPRTEDEIELNRYIYADLHLREGRSAEAVRTAYAYLTKIETLRFQDPDRAEAHGEFAYQTGNLSLATARKQDKRSKAIEWLEFCVQVIRKHYPVAETKKTARKKNAYWEPVFEETENAQLRCLRDQLKLYDTLMHVTPNNSILMASQAIINTLNLHKEQLEKYRGFLLLLLERGTFDQAIHAYETLIKIHGKSLFQHNRSELAQIVTKGIDRRLRREQSLWETPEMERRYKSWALQRTTNSGNDMNPKIIERLGEIHYIGLGVEVGILDIRNQEILGN